MKLIPTSVTRMVGEQALRAQKHAPTILFGVGVTSMVGSTVLACRATLKLDEVIGNIEDDKKKAELAKEMVENGEVKEGTTYTDEEMERDLHIIKVRGIVAIGKLYAPAVILGGVGILCLTKSHKILMDRNAALTAAYIVVDTAFKRYRQRVVDRFGEDTDRELRFDAEVYDEIDEETGKISSGVHAAPGELSGYARWWDEESSRSWNDPNSPQGETYNRLFLRNQQNWCNDMLRARGHVFLNEVYSCIGLTHTSAGAIVGWVYDRNNDRGDNYIDFGCWERDEISSFHNGRDGAILLDFNVDGPIWDLMDKRNTSDRDIS